MNTIKPEKEPETIGKYKIIGKLGRGGMGDIYKAIQEPLNRVVALKVLPPSLSRDSEFSVRFEAEAKAISLLQHQNITSIYEYGEEDGYRFFTMQYVDGVDLAKRIHVGKHLSIPEVIDISKQICRGLRYAHERNIVHRDIKPQNILIDTNGVVRISDFGIAKIFSNNAITVTGMTVGTPEYMSPEQGEGGVLDVQTDLYSMGIVMYEMLTKSPPFTADNPMAIIYKHVYEHPAAPSLKRKDTPKRLELIVLKALKKNKAERYLLADEMLKDLDSVDLNEVPDAPTVSMKAKKAEEDRQAEIDNRITDRRGGPRRKTSTSLPQSPGGILDSIRYQITSHWFLVALLVVLAAIFTIHLFITR